MLILRRKTVLHHDCKRHRKELTVIARGWEKYHDLSVASRLIICQSRRLRQIIDLRDTDKSRYFAITEFNNCFIIRPPSLLFNEYPWGSEAICHFHARAITRRRKALFAGHVVGSRSMKRKKNLLRMIIRIIIHCTHVSPFSMANSLQLILEISATNRLVSYLLADNWLICRLRAQCMISNNNINSGSLRRCVCRYFLRNNV